MGYYDNGEIDLKYPEIAIALEDIYRPNPGTIKFNVPILTQRFGADKAKSESKPLQSTNILNDNRNIGINNATTINYIEIKVPRELTAYLNGKFRVEEEMDNEISTETSIYDNSHTYSTESSGGDSHSHSFSIGGKGYEEARHGKSHTKSKGLEEIWAIDDTIKAGSKWVVVFIGGDINNARIIAPYYE